MSMCGEGLLSTAAEVAAAAVVVVFCNFGGCVHTAGGLCGQSLGVQYFTWKCGTSSSSILCVGICCCCCLYGLMCVPPPRKNIFFDHNSSAARSLACALCALDSVPRGCYPRPGRLCRAGTPKRPFYSAAASEQRRHDGGETLRRVRLRIWGLFVCILRVWRVVFSALHGQSTNMSASPCRYGTFE